MKVRILRPAFNDLAAGREFYERHQIGLGDRFFDSLFVEIDLLAQSGGIHRQQFGFHRALARRFPYAIYYRLIAGEVAVFRVLDCRRDPRLIRRALQ